MTNIIEEAEVINRYLCQVKKNLPLGIRLRKNELNDILDEIEEHIWEKAIESAGDKEPNEFDVQIAISQMGEPQDIAKKFRSGSIPYVYISEELYPYYKNYRKLLFWASIISFFLYTIVQYFAPLPFDLGFYQITLTFSNVGSIIVIYLSFSIILVIIFCYLSKTGYIPYNLRKIKMLNQFDNSKFLQDPKFQQPFREITLFFEVSPFLLYIPFPEIWTFYYPYFLVLAVVKCLRIFLKRTSIIWQKSLILVDIFITTQIFQMRYSTYYSSDDLNPLISLIAHPYGVYSISIFIYLLFFIYIYCEIYLFMNFKENMEYYLKEISLNKRINKKEVIFRSIKKEYKQKRQNNLLENKTLQNKSNKHDSEIEETIKIYLRTVKKKLPLWLKKAEKNEVIKVLKEELREISFELKESNRLTQETLVQRIDDLGIFETVLSDYKQEGIPKLYISKELWPWYLRTLKFVLTYLSVIFLITIIIPIIYMVSFELFILSFMFSFIEFPILIFSIYIITYLFGFLSLNDFIPENNDFAKTLINIIPIQKRIFYYIWEISFTGFYIWVGIYLVSNVIFGNFSLNFSDIFYIILISALFLLLGGIKMLIINSKQNMVELKSILIILSIFICLIINFIANPYYSNNYISSIITLPKFSEFVILLINIEIFYEIFHLFFKNKKISE